MPLAIVTGSAGLIGSEVSRFFALKGFDVVGIDNDMRRYFFGAEASTHFSRQRLQALPGYTHVDADIRDLAVLEPVFKRHGREIALVVHTAAQPSHDWAASKPLTDFAVNATATLNLLELTHRHSHDAVFIFTSTNKVYGDTPNHLPLVEEETRWELSPEHPYAAFGIDETMSIDGTLHSLFGASKLAADVLVQEYGRYFGMRTAAFRCGCLTGSGHAGTQLHGFLAYLVKCAITSAPYKVLGYRGKQVRDNLHARDLVTAFWHFFESPKAGEVYNMGGARHANCSVLEAIALAEALTGKPMAWSYSDANRTGDHIWWISDIRKFQSHYPAWSLSLDMAGIVREVYEGLMDRLTQEVQ
jgi:CDP-paratose 2-epimerase